MPYAESVKMTLARQEVYHEGMKYIGKESTTPASALALCAVQSRRSPNHRCHSANNKKLIVRLHEQNVNTVNYQSCAFPTLSLGVASLS